MRQILSISIDPRLNSQIDKEAKKEKISKSMLVKEALKRYLVYRSYRNLRSKLIPYGEKADYFTDEDIFKEEE